MKFIQLSTDATIKRLRWLMVFVILSDAVITLAGQPPGVWQDPSKVRELNQLTHWVMVHGLSAYVGCSIIYIGGALIMASLLPRRLGLMVILSFTLMHFHGTSTWLVYHYHLGVQSNVILAIVLAIAAVLFGLDTANPSSDNRRS